MAAEEGVLVELRILRYFLTVAREENITKAAALLHLTQPTLSRQLHQLEEELGIQLFYRTSHHIVLTEEGMLFRRRAQEIIDLTEKTRAEFSTEAADLAGQIAIGCGETRNMRELSDWMLTMQQQYPLVTFQVQSFTADVVLERLANGLLDLGLLMEPVDIRKYEVLRMPLKEEWGILVRQDSALAGLEQIAPQDLAGVPLIMPERLSVQNALQRWFGDAYDGVQLTATYNLMLNAVFMVERGLGVAIGYRFDRFFPDLRFIPLGDIPAAGAVLAWKKQQLFSKTVRRFLAICRGPER